VWRVCYVTSAQVAKTHSDRHPNIFSFCSSKKTYVTLKKRAGAVSLNGRYGTR